MMTSPTDNLVRTATGLRVRGMRNHAVVNAGTKVLFPKEGLSSANAYHPCRSSRPPAPGRCRAFGVETASRFQRRSFQMAEISSVDGPAFERDGCRDQFQRPWRIRFRGCGRSSRSCELGGLPLEKERGGRALRGKSLTLPAIGLVELGRSRWDQLQSPARSLRRPWPMHNAAFSQARNRACRRDRP